LAITFPLKINFENKNLLANILQQKNPAVLSYGKNLIYRVKK